MSNVIISPDMNLPLPVPGQDPGPDYANNNNAAFLIVDGHDHSAGKGALIQPNGLDISSDLTFLLNNATNLRSARFATQTTALVGATDLGAIYNINGNLYWNNNSGVAVQITNGTSIVGTAGSITGLPSGTASVSYSGGVYVFQSATSTSAILDAGSIVVRNATAGSNGITISAPAGLATNSAFVLPVPPSSSPAPLIMDTAGNVTATAASITGAMIASATITSTNIAPGTIGNAFGISPSCGAFTTTGSNVVVTNLNVTITTGGRPVMLLLTDDGTGAVASVGNSNSGSVTPLTDIAFYRGVTRLGGGRMLGQFVGSSSPNMQVPASSFSHFDIVAAGTYTYTVQVSNGFVGGTANVTSARLVAYEL